MIVSNHAEKRMRERLSLSKKACQRHAQKVFDVGKSHGSFSGGFKRYLDGEFLSRRTASNIKVYGQHVYLFSSKNVLITVLQVPSKFRKHVD